MRTLKDCLGRHYNGMQLGDSCDLYKSPWDYTFDYTFAVVFKGI